jgi:hypothetical protein
MKSEIYDVLKKYGVFVTVCIFFMLQLSSGEVQHLSPYNLYPYVMSYQRFGFGSRFFIGSVIDLFTETVPESLIIMIAFFATMLFYMTAAGFMQSCYNKTAPEKRMPILALYAFILLSPTINQFLAKSQTYGKLETYLQIIVFLIIALSSRRFGIWLVPILCVMGVAIYQNFIFLYFAPLVVIILLKIAKSTDKRAFVKLTAVLGLTVILTCSAFLLFQFKKDLTYDSPEAIRAEIAKYSDVELLYKTNEPKLVTNPVTGETYISLEPEYNEEPCNDALLQEYFYGIKDHFNIYFLDPENGNYFPYKIFEFFANIILLSPLFIFLILFYKGSIKNTDDKKVKWVYRLGCLSMASYLPPFMLTVDYGRWFYALFFIQFVLVIYLAATEEAASRSLSEIFERYVKKHPIGIGVLLLYFSAMGNLHLLYGFEVVKKLQEAIF